MKNLVESQNQRINNTEFKCIIIELISTTQATELYKARLFRGEGLVMDRKVAVPDSPREYYKRCVCAINAIPFCKVTDSSLDSYSYLLQFAT